MHHPRGGHALIAFQGRLYAIGGNTVAANVTAVEAYDAAAGAWTDVGSLPAPRNHVAGFVFAESVCVAGGRFPITARVDCFDPAGRTWFRLQDLPRPTSGAGAATLESGDVVVMGGEDAQESRIVGLYARLPSTKVWTSSAMLVPRHGFELAVYEGRAWACGGGAQAGLHPVATCTSVV
jgi:hypothetical protein